MRSLFSGFAGEPVADSSSTRNGAPFNTLNRAEAFLRCIARLLLRRVKYEPGDCYHTGYLSRPPVFQDSKQAARTGETRHRETSLPRHLSLFFPPADPLDTVDASAAAPILARFSSCATSVRDTGRYNVMAVDRIHSNQGGRKLECALRGRQRAASA